MPKDLEGISGLILPGGESSTMIKLCDRFELWEPLKESKIPFWGVCAGSILMAKTVENPNQKSLAKMDITVRRNAYGRHAESFQENILLSTGKEEQAVFIRAPKFISWSSGVTVAGTVREEAVFLRQGKNMVTAFHPELTDSSWAHELFLRFIL